MRNAVRYLADLLKKIIFLGFGIQIILGIVWMCFNLPYFREFGAEGGPVYRLLYPLLTKCYPLTYLLQVLCAFCAGMLCLGKLNPGMASAKKWLGGLTLLTLPLAMQCHLSVSPYSFAASAFLCGMVSTACAFRNPGKRLREYAKGAVWFAIAPLFVPACFLPGLLTLLVALAASLYRLRKQMGLFARMAVVTAACIGLTAGVFSLDGTALLPDRETVYFHLAGRLCWPKLFADHSVWPEDLQEIYRDSVLEISCYADEMEQSFRPIMLAHFDKETAVEQYRVLMRIARNRHKTLLRKQMAGDFATYLAAPVFLPLQLKGRLSVSYAGRNYEQMLEHTPVLSARYVNFGCVFFPVAGLAAVLAAVLAVAGGSRKISKQNAASEMITLTSSVSLCLVFTLRGAGIADYKGTIAVSLLWMLWMFTATEVSAEASDA